MDACRKEANDLAPQITDENIPTVYFAVVDMTVKENKDLWEKFGLKSDSCDEYPVGVVMYKQKGKRFEGPAITSIFSRYVKEFGGISDDAEGEEGENVDAEGEEPAEGEGETPEAR